MSFCNRAAANNEFYGDLEDWIDEFSILEVEIRN